MKGSWIIVLNELRYFAIYAVYILLIKNGLGKKLVAFQMLINFGVGDTGSNQIINVNLPTQFPWVLILDIQLRGNDFSPKWITDFCHRKDVNYC